MLTVALTFLTLVIKVTMEKDKSTLTSKNTSYVPDDVNE